MADDDADQQRWWVIHDADLMHMLRRVSDGEDPDLVFAEHYANSEHERH